MPRGDKSSYTGKQQRKAQHIEDSYRERGVGEDEAERRAWATVNKQEGGGKKSGSGRKGGGAKSGARKSGSSSRKSSSRKTSSNRKSSATPKRGGSKSRGGKGGSSR